MASAMKSYVCKIFDKFTGFNSYDIAKIFAESFGEALFL